MATILSITFPNSYLPPYNKVEVIKTIRELSYMGLKEAKDLSETLEPQSLVVSGISEARIDELCHILRRNGCQVGGRVHQILDDLRKLGAQALTMGEDELANEILQLVLAEKLRRPPGQ